MCVWNLFSRKRLLAERRRRIAVVFRGFEDEGDVVAKDNDDAGGEGGARERGITGAWGFRYRRCTGGVCGPSRRGVVD